MGDQRVYAVTGGTGSLGTALTHTLIAAGHKVRTISRNEHRISALEASLHDDQRSRLSTLIGDVRDRYRLHRAFERVDYVIHAAALKGVGRCEYDPAEAMKTNVIGTQAVADACLDAGVKRAVFISSDKAVYPVNMYGATKALGERLWIGANKYSAGIGTQFLAVRYGNCWGSNGSVIRVWEGSRGGKLRLTDPEATRFHLRVPDAVRFVLSILDGGAVGSVYVPFIPSYRLRDLAAAFSPEAEREVIGLQPGEKLHECLVNEYEVAHAVKDGAWIRIDPALQGEWVGEYTSGRNTHKLTVAQLREEIAWLKSNA